MAVAVMFAHRRAVLRECHGRGGPRRIVQNVQAAACGLPGPFGVGRFAGLGKVPRVTVHRHLAAEALGGLNVAVHVIRNPVALRGARVAQQRAIFLENRLYRV